MINRSLAALILSVSLGFFMACQKDDDVVLLPPVAGDNFENIENDGYWVQLNADPVKEGQTGTWGVVVGEHGRFEDRNAHNSKFYGEPGENYVLSWEVKQGEAYKTDEITVSFKAMEAAIKMEPVDTLHDNISLHLDAVRPQFGASGHWELISGQSGRIEQADSSKALFIGVEDREYTVRWNQTYGSKVDFVDYTFRTDTLRAFAGMDDEDVLLPGNWNERKFYTLRAHAPAGATCQWSVLEGEDITIYDEQNHASMIEAQGGNFYKLLWSVEVDGRSAIDTLELQFRGKYGKWIDPRDGNEYRTVLIDQHEWLAENYRYDKEPGTYSFYYGLDQGIVVEGDVVDTEAEKRKYGRLYSDQGWINIPELWRNETWNIITYPEGWYLPSEQDYLDVVSFYGGPGAGTPQMLDGGRSGLDLVFSGYMTMNNDEHTREYNGQGSEAFYHTSDYIANDNGEWLNEVIAVNESVVGSYRVGMFNHGFAIRLIRKANFDY